MCELTNEHRLGVVKNSVLGDVRGEEVIERRRLRSWEFCGDNQGEWDRPGTRSTYTEDKEHVKKILFARTRREWKTLLEYVSYSSVVMQALLLYPSISEVCK